MKTKFLLVVFVAIGFVLNNSAEEPRFNDQLQIKVNVLGEVKNPSRITLPTGASVLDALASVGSTTNDADMKHVKIIHQSNAEKPDVTKVDVKKILNGTAANVILHNGDTIDVPKSFIGVRF